MARKQQKPTRAAQAPARPSADSPAPQTDASTDLQPTPTPEAQHPDLAAALAQKANEAEQLRNFIDRTTFAGDERESSGELSSVDQHPADFADVTMQRALDYTIKGIVEDEVQQVELAMRRQAEGRYGICEECGQEIDPERLAVRPQATLCIACQRQREEGPHGH